ncbi:methyltransferase-like protein 27 [Liolophura sinensis]|uniref:methyltransferase-like protein 27 n=1 Tax=Liolophura sinensis TaxID=3198878 RepID=UPI003158129A
MESERDNQAYGKNYGAHRPGITSQEMADYYSNWAKSGDYEKDLCPGRYNGPTICAQALADHYKENRETVKILDVAAGTGFLGEQLTKLGFRNLDALDPAQGMLDVAKEKGIYHRLVCDFLGPNQLDIDKDSYDCAAIAGGMGEGHIPYKGLDELIRIVKQGGLICIVMREEYLSTVEEYRGNLEKHMQSLVDSGKWARISRNVVPNYSFNKNGVVFKYRVC